MAQSELTTSGAASEGRQKDHVPTAAGAVSERIDRLEEALAELGKYVRVMLGHGMNCPQLQAIIVDVDERAKEVTRG